MRFAFPDAAEAYQDFRSRVWSDARPMVRDDLVALESELELQARWFGGEFGRRFIGTDGERIEIVQFGHWNRSAGPDFTESAVKIDGVLNSGAIEIDSDVRDWESHRHGVNPEFEPVVLHVFKDGPSLDRFYTRTNSHRKVVQLQLPQYAWSQGPPDFLPEAFPGRCVAPLSLMTDEEVELLLLCASQHRLLQKRLRLNAMSASVSKDQALYQAVAEALGFHQNKTAMAILAQRCPISELGEMNPLEREARLFGAAGFLDREVFDEAADSNARRYLRELWSCWWKMRDQIEPSPSRAIPWRFAGSRPGNHPQRRVGALAAIVGQWEELSSLWENPVNKVEKFVNNSFNNLRHPFWEHHFTVRAKPIEGRLRLLGQDRRRDILGNVLFPALMGEEPYRWDEFRLLRSSNSNQKLRRAGLRLFGKDEKRGKLFTSYYHQQQGLLQIYQDFCLEDLSECDQCPFPEQLSQWQHAQEGSLVSTQVSTQVST
tara:strand:+ start:907 stop:2367 length:1461 start_codon:yes stop_codon:yes gene_type:complete